MSGGGAYDPVKLAERLLGQKVESAWWENGVLHVRMPVKIPDEVTVVVTYSR